MAIIVLSKKVTKVKILKLTINSAMLVLNKTISLWISFLFFCFSIIPIALLEIIHDEYYHFYSIMFYFSWYTVADPD